jgi:transcriptional regulator NrdR family protein
MVRVEKRSGELEEFDTSKLEASLARAGVSEEQATRIAEKVARSVTEGTATAQVMAWAATELRHVNPTAAKKYESFKSGHASS